MEHIVHWDTWYKRIGQVTLHQGKPYQVIGREKRGAWYRISAERIPNKG